MSRIFDDFGRISGLQLNLAKTPVIPVFPTNLNQLQNAIARTLPVWGGVNVSHYRVYIGFVVGPVGPLNNRFLGKVKIC